MPSVDLLSTVGRSQKRLGRALAVSGGLLCLGAAGFAFFLLSPRSVRPSLEEPGRSDRAVPRVLVATDSPPAAELPELAVSRRGRAGEPQQSRRKPAVWWLDQIAREAKLGVVVAPGLDNELTAAFPPDISWRERLAALARAGGFKYRVAAGLIEARPAQPDEQADKEPDKVAAQARAGAGPPPAWQVLRLRNARAGEVVHAVAQAARLLGGTIAADADSNSLVFAGPGVAVHQLIEMAGHLDLPRRRFLLEARIVELSRSAREELGINWSLAGTVGASVDLPAAAREGEAAALLVATGGANALEARLGALEAQGRVRIVSRPRIVVIEGRSASIESVRILRIRLPDRSAFVAGEKALAEVTSSRAVEEIPVGVSLHVEPSLQGEGRIALHIRAKSSTLGPPQPPDGIPEELSRVVDAEVLVENGETAVLGGLLREGRTRSGQGVPLLRSIPVLGLLFGRHSREQQGEELLVLVTPRLLN